MTTDTASSNTWNPIPDAPIPESLVIGFLVFGICILGIETRAIFSLASLWPANALLLGTLIARPRANRPLTWLAAVLAYAAADLLSGSSLTDTFWLNLANLAGVTGGVLIARFFSRSVMSPTQPIHAFLGVPVIIVASTFTGLVGIYVGPNLFGMSCQEGFAVWFSAEAVNYAIFLPPILSSMSHDPDRYRFFSRNPQVIWRQIGALAALLASMAVVYWVGGPGATAYLIPGLLWIGVRFRPFASSLFTMFAASWVLVLAPLGAFHTGFDMQSALNISSFRLGVGTIVVSLYSVTLLNGTWRRLNEALSYTARHDALTGLGNRAAFMSALDRHLSDRAGHGQVSLIMIDVDRFKLINDTYGHPAGDQVLRDLAEQLRASVRPDDVVGRLGGEEFAVLLPDTGIDDALAVGDRLRRAVAAAPMLLPSGEAISVTVSLGIAACDRGEQASPLMSAADSALYAAKHGGRNMVVAAPGPMREHSTRPAARYQERRSA